MDYNNNNNNTTASTVPTTTATTNGGSIAPTPPLEHSLSPVTSSANVEYTSPPSGIGVIPTNLECLVTMEDITEENYVEYQIYPSYEWKSSLLSQPIIEMLLQTQFQTYMERIQASDCQAELKRLLQQGPPIYISDPYGLPLVNQNHDDDHDDNNDTPDDAVTLPSNTNTTTFTPAALSSSPPTSQDHSYVMNLWYASDQQIHSSIVHNAVLGEAHAQLWKELQSYLIPSTNTNTTSTTTTNTDTTSSTNDR